MWISLGSYRLKGRTMAQADSPRTLTAKASFRVRLSSRGICGGKSGRGKGFISEFFGYHLSVVFHRGSILIRHMGDEH
jgi:hypothetical protein